MSKWWRRVIEFLADVEEEPQQKDIPIQQMLRNSIKAEQPKSEEEAALEKSQINTFARHLKQHEKLVAEYRIKYLAAIAKIIEQHYKTLDAKYEQLAYTDDYGRLVLDKFIPEFGYFFSNVLCPVGSALFSETYVAANHKLWNSYQKLDKEYANSPVYRHNMESTKPTYDWYWPTFFCFSLALKKGGRITKDGKINFTLTTVEDSFEEKEHMASLEGNELLIQMDSKILLMAMTIFDYMRIMQNAWANVVFQATGVKKKRTAPNDPLEYEKYVSLCLKDLGFKVRTTKASGDQGADVIAEKNGVSFAIQCKKYSGQVGNKAVQEANAGRDFYKCDYGVVVSNASFTKSAKQAANACKIILLNDRQLEKLLKYVPVGDANK